MKNNEKRLLEKFVKNAILHSEGTEVGDHKKTNRAYHQLNKVVEKMQQYDPALNELVPLLQDQNDSVRLWSSSFLLNCHAKEAVITLKALSKKKGLTAFDAKMTLKNWFAKNKELP